MTQQVVVPNKRRRLVDQTITGVTPIPTFPVAGSVSSPAVFKGDMTGARIAGFEVRVGAFDTLTSLGLTIQHSNDGSVWHTYMALTAMSASTNQIKMLDSADDQPMRYLRLLPSAAGGSFGSAAGVILDILYNQFGAKGRFAPPGKNDLLS